MHNDLKGNNLMIKDGHVKIVDFGWKNVFLRDFCDEEWHSGEEIVSAHE